MRRRKIRTTVTGSFKLGYRHFEGGYNWNEQYTNYWIRLLYGMKNYAGLGGQVFSIKTEKQRVT